MTPGAFPESSPKKQFFFNLEGWSLKIYDKPWKYDFYMGTHQFSINHDLVILADFFSLKCLKCFYLVIKYLLAYFFASKLFPLLFLFYLSLIWQLFRWCLYGKARVTKYVWIVWFVICCVKIIRAIVLYNASKSCQLYSKIFRTQSLFTKSTDAGSSLCISCLDCCKCLLSDLLELSMLLINLFSTQQVNAIVLKCEWDQYHSLVQFSQ